ncbi:MAG: DUF6198 family protein [Angelakisella sp.]
MIKLNKQVAILSAKKFAMYTLGLLFLALGVTASIKSDLGVSPLNSMPYVLSQITGMEMGMVVTATFSTFILLQILILRKEFKVINLLQLPFASISGYFISMTNSWFSLVPPAEGVIMKLAILALGIVIVAFGLLFYLTAEIVPLPPEGFMLAITQKTGIPFPKTKVGVDCGMVGMAALMSVAAFGKLAGVGVGTILSAIFIGKTLGVLSKRGKPMLKALLQTKLSVQ